MTTAYHAEAIILRIREQIAAARRTLCRIECECDLAGHFGDLGYANDRFTAIAKAVDLLDQQDCPEKIRELIHSWQEQRAANRENVQLESDERAEMKTYL